MHVFGIILTVVTVLALTVTGIVLTSASTGTGNSGDHRPHHPDRGATAGMTIPRHIVDSNNTTKE